MRLWLLCLTSTLLLTLGSPSQAQVIISPKDLSTDLSSVISDLDQAQVVYLGEIHEQPAVHSAQLQLIQALWQQDPKLAIGMEMFQRPFQTVLDQYSRGDLSLADLREQTEYDQRWGYDWSLYAPILQFAQTHQIPVLALNTPQEITRQVAQAGLSSLEASDFEWIPALKDIYLEDPPYRQYLLDFFNSFHEGVGNQAGFENFYAAQILWDETMADQISRYLLQHPDQTVVVLVGQGHVIFNYGIPSRVERRLRPHFKDQVFTQRTMLLGSVVLPSSDGVVADYVLQVE